MKKERERRTGKQSHKKKLIEKQKKFDEELRRKNKQFMKRRESQPKLKKPKEGKQSPPKPSFKPVSRSDFRQNIGLKDVPDEVIRQKVRKDRETAKELSKEQSASFIQKVPETYNRSRANSRHLS